MKSWILSFLLLRPGLATADGSDGRAFLDWESDPVTELKRVLSALEDRQDPPAAAAKAQEAEERQKKLDVARFDDLMKKIEKGQAVDQKDLEWAKSNLSAGLASKKVLMIVTSHDQLGNTGEKTGFWMEELAAPYLLFGKSGLAVDIASPKGGAAPADRRSLDNPPEVVKSFLSSKEAVEKLKATLALDKIDGGYDAYFVVGGHGVLWDLVYHAGLQKLLSGAYEKGGIVAAVCHGPAALTEVRLKNGDPLVKGRKVSGFSNDEEKAAKLDGVVPFALETKLKSLGGLYESGAMWASFAVRDGRLVTGQNPASSEAVAAKILEALKEELGKRLASAKTK